MNFYWEVELMWSSTRFFWVLIKKVLFRNKFLIYFNYLTVSRKNFIKGNTGDNMERFMSS